MYLVIAAKLSKNSSTELENFKMNRLFIPFFHRSASVAISSMTLLNFKARLTKLTLSSIAFYNPR
jgi:hypothetical protein